MPKKFLKNFLFLLLCLDFGCQNQNVRPREIYMLSDYPEIQSLEAKDHKFCHSLDLDSGSSNKNFRGDLYWRCRLSMAKYKLKPHVSLPQDVLFNSRINELITKITLSLSGTGESVFAKENKKLDKRHHEQCVSLGFEFNLIDRQKTDDYLLCRKRLMDNEQLDPPYGNEEYLKYPNRAYDLPFIIDSRIDDENKKRLETQRDYPTCINFLNKEDEFKECTQAQDQSRQCLAEIDSKRFKKESEQKTQCQRQAYIRFPESLLKDHDRRQKDLETTKTNADVYNQNNFSALGIADDVGLFESEENKARRKAETEAQRKLEKNINSKTDLYTRYDLTRLRQKYIIACQQNSNSDLVKYVEDLKKNCDEIAKYPKAN